jgi:hypothetical protein
MIQMQDMVKANLTIRPTGQNLTSECYIICQSANPVLNGVCLWCHSNIPECSTNDFDFDL